MAVWSSLASKNNFNLRKNVINFLRNGLKGKAVNAVPVRYSHDRMLEIRTSTFEYFRFKNFLHIYLMIGIVPIALLVTFVNIFIGPAELALIPEGYEPKHWEYYEHPITRFFARYCRQSPQELYEKNMHTLFFSNERKEIRKLEKKIKLLMQEKKDYQTWFFTKPMVKYERKMIEDSERYHLDTGGKGGKTIF